MTDLDRPRTDLRKADLGRIRVSDTDRERVATWLREAAGRGELTLAEADERQAAAYRAVTRADLAPLTADLPEHRVVAPPPSRWRLYTVLAVAATILLAAYVAAVATGHQVFPFPLFWVAFFGFARFRHHGPGGRGHHRY